MEGMLKAISRACVCVGLCPTAPFVSAMKRAVLVLTDSGGVQEEAPALRKPVLVLRNESERREAIEAGVAKLVGQDRATIVAEAGRLLDDPEATDHARGSSATETVMPPGGSPRSSAASWASARRCW